MINILNNDARSCKKVSLNVELSLIGKRNRCRFAIDLFYIIASDTLDVSHTQTNKKVVKSFSIFLKEKSAKSRRVQLVVK